MVLAIPLRANTGLICVAWLREILQDPAGDMCGPTLPAVDKWRDSCFVQALPFVGGRNGDIPMVAPLVAIDVWGAAKAGSNKPPWGQVNNLCEHVLTHARLSLPHRLPLQGGYPDAQLFSVLGNGTEPKRIPDIESYAHMGFMLEFNWAPVEEIA